MEAMTGLSVAEAHALLADTNLITVGARGDEERHRHHGTRASFVRVLDVHVDAVPEAIPAHASPGEIRVVGCPGSFDAAVAAVARAAVLAGSIPFTAFALSDLAELCGGDLSKLRDLCRALRGAGLRAIADAPLDLVDEQGDAVRAARDGGLSVPRLTIHSLAGKTTIDNRLALLAGARSLQASVGGFTVFAPLARVSPVAQPSTGYDDVRQVAVARLLVDNIDHIQVDWALYGPKLAQVALTMGADDVDSVSPLEGDLGRRRSPIEEIRGNIKSAGLEPLERKAFV